MTDKTYESLMERAKREFNFKKWRAWLEAKDSELQGAGLETSFRHGPDDGKKPGMILEILRGKLYGGFENWVTGETDYTILDNAILGPHGRPKQVAMKWGQIVNDQTFEPTFNEFLAEFLRYEREAKK